MISSSFPDPSTVMVPSVYYGHDPTMDAYSGRRMFKKHKVLPHPDRDRAHAIASFAYDSWPSRTGEDKYPVGAARPSKGNIASNNSPQTPNHPPRTIHNGPRLPPTPPAPSQNSSGSLSALPSSSVWAVSPLDADGSAPALSPATPPNEQGPPTPDVTPPQRVARPRAVRALLSDRTPSKSASDSRSGSFKTAREEPYTSEDERSSLAHPALPSARTSQSTVRHVGKDDETLGREKQPNGQARTRDMTDPNATPRSKVRPVTFDGEWRMNTGDTEVVQEWDDYLQRHVRVRKSRPYPDPKTPSPNDRQGEEIRDDAMVTPTNATMAVRAMHLHALSDKRTSSNSVTDPDKEGSSVTSSPTTTDVRRLSGLSTKSGVSTVVEAVLVDPVVPQRRRTLRHVKKQTALRSSNPDITPGSSAPASSSTLQEAPVRPNPSRRPADGRYNSRASATSVNSISSAKARKEVWNQGAIPVVIVPDRKSSTRKSGEPTLRSTSSRRSKQSASLASAPLSNGSTSKEAVSTSERPLRHGRSVSEATGSDIRTLDYPPVVPKRTSSLSAPTSRNASRTGSLTADSLKAHDALMEAEKLKHALSRVEHGNKLETKNLEKDDSEQQQQQQQQQSTLQPTGVAGHAAASIEDEEGSHRLSLGDPLFAKRVSNQNTPFSLASMDTSGTAPEVSEALAVNIYAHQNTSVLMVDHGSSKPSQDSDVEISKESQPAGVRSSTDKLQPTITTTAPESDEPATPLQQQRSDEDVDYSPLRNPRSPPEPPAGPPAIQFIPATPSGATPAHERRHLMGNYFDEMEPRPKRSVSLVRRVLPRRRHSESVATSIRPSFLSRTLSLSRGVRKVAEPFAVERSSDKALPDPPYPTADDPPADERMLHPFWQPAYSDFDLDTDSSSSSEDAGEFNSDGQYERVYRYPPIDNRPRRSLSQRLKRTFAVLPLEDDMSRRFDDTTSPGTERRTIERTPSGNLRVVRRRRSLDEGGEPPQHDGRPYTAPDSPDPTPSFWRGYRRGNNSARVGEEEKKSFLPTLGSKIGGLPRRLSERRREKRTTELRRTISGPREVRDGVGEVIRQRGYHI